jgi:hypothetical protein
MHLLERCRRAVLDRSADAHRMMVIGTPVGIANRLPPHR